MTVRRYLTALTSAPTYRYLQVAMLLVLGTAFVTSFESGTEGAKRLGYPEGFESALPLVCDVIAGVATLIHGRVRGDRQMRRLASLFVLVPMLLSWGANSVDHLGSAPADPRWLLAAQVGWVAGVILAAGICPVSVAALLHLSAKFVEYEQRQAEKAERRAASTPKPRSRRDADTSPGARPCRITAKRSTIPIHRNGR